MQSKSRLRHERRGEIFDAISRNIDLFVGENSLLSESKF